MSLVPFARRRSTAELFSWDGRDWAENRRRGDGWKIRLCLVHPARSTNGFERGFDPAGEEKAVRTKPERNPLPKSSVYFPSHKSACKSPHSNRCRCRRTKPRRTSDGSGEVSRSAGRPVVHPKNRYIASRTSHARHLPNPAGGSQKSDNNHRASGFAAPAKRPTNLSCCSGGKQSRTKWLATKSNSRAGGVHSKISAWTNWMPSAPNPAASKLVRARSNIRALASTQTH